ncbi:membrane magnesium transporter [Lolium perenne]|nr:membrane magnesium transporter [Lolium perenne]
MGIGYVLGAIGGALLVHAAYATIQYRAVLKITEEEFSHPPFDVIIQLLVGLALCMWAGVSVPAKFLSVLPHSEENRIVSLPANLDFMIFNHRGRALPSDADLKLKI